MTKAEAAELLAKYDQSHVLDGWDQLNSDQRESLLEQIATLDFENIRKMQSLLSAPEKKTVSEFAPAPVIPLAEGADPGLRKRGEECLRAGHVGVVLVAGGQGSRLGFDGPKGAYPIGPVSGAPLFEIHSRKIRALEQKFSTEIPFYIMTSQTNDGPTRTFFEQHDWFGLSEERVRFFSQGMWPALSAEGKIVCDRPDHIFMSPDGHGGILAALRERGMLADMQKRGLKSLFYFQVDNPLVEIADPVFLGLQQERSADIAVKVCAKRDPHEGLGVVVVRDGRQAVVEYTELTDEQKNARQEDGTLRFNFGSVAIHIFSMDFLVQEAERDLPLHVAHKKVPVWIAADGHVEPDTPNAFKFEKFIFDVLPDAETAVNVEFRREMEFSPVKNAEGADSPATTRRDMGLKFAEWFEQIGIEVPRDGEGLPLHWIEIDPCYALGPDDLKVRLPDDFEVSGDVWLR